MRQYFFEDEKNGTPFRRDKRALVYQRAKMRARQAPFGTQYDVYARRLRVARPFAGGPRSRSRSDFRVTIGGADCTQPYDASHPQHLGDELRRAVAPTRSGR